MAHHPKFIGKRWDMAQHTARKAAGAAVKAAHGQGQSVPALRERLDTMEKALGVV